MAQIIILKLKVSPTLLQQLCLLQIGLPGPPAIHCVNVEVGMTSLEYDINNYLK